MNDLNEGLRGQRTATDYHTADLAKMTGPWLVATRRGSSPRHVTSLLLQFDGCASGFEFGLRFFGVVLAHIFQYWLWGAID